ncbi:GNAT family N-acetyltransferase [Vreelandella olivaria]|uniref:GNAT family N-acetyltransferase n=1 Tax=Vreelandella olivaria TaxID=390919 RepID=UPI00201FA547|nr:GNAT family N-acetyltransferase [Halomonas olivaria]
MENIVIADLTSSFHAEAVVSLLNDYAKDKMGGASELSDFVKSNLVSELEKRPYMFAVLAFVQNEPAGLAICVEGFSSFACRPLINIHDLFVSSKYRGRKLSQKLLAKAEEVAKERKCCKLTLEVLEGNKVAQSAYLSFGFEGYELDPEIGKALFWQKKLL